LDLQIRCPRCGAFVEAEKVFCIRCGHRVIPLTVYDLSVDDFVYPPDREGLESLKQFKFAFPVINALLVERYVKEVLRWLSKNASRIDFSSKLGSMIRESALILGLRSLPPSYIAASDKPNAFTFGSTKQQYLVITSKLLDLLSEDEVKAVIGHELGHIKCEHVAYHTLAEILMRGMEFSSRILGAGLELLSPMFRLMLLSWHRESEISADRASLLVAGDLRIVESALRKLEKYYGEGGGPVESLFEVFSTHPIHPNRIKMLREYYRSSEYSRAVEKIRRRLSYAKALTPRCRYCGAVKKITDLFCPVCGRSQI